MKNVLKLIVVIAVISALTLAVFAASPGPIPIIEPEETTGEQTPDEGEGDLTNESGADEIVSATAEVPEGLKIEIVAPTEEAANLAAASAEHPDGVPLESFDVNLIRVATGEELHSGATVTITITVPEEYVGGTLYLYEDGALAQTIAISSTTVTIVLTSFSTYTPVLVKAAAGTTDPGTDTPPAPGPGPGPGPGPVTPQTMQTLLPIALAVLAVAAVAVAVIARKRSFN